MERNESTGFEGIYRPLDFSCVRSHGRTLRMSLPALRGAHRAVLILLAVLLLPPVCRGGSISLSYTGASATSEDYFEQAFTLSAPSTIEIQTWGFGGGTNAAGVVIPAGGFDPLVALFSGPPAAASIFMSGGNPAADADTLGDYVGNCPPAAMLTIGTGAGSVICGDDALTVLGVPAGVYTLALSDAAYIPFAVNPGPPISSLLSDGFADFTGGVFQTCNTTSDGTTCITPSANFAVDIVDQTGVGLNQVPEPAAALTLIGLAALGMFRRATLKV
jgi:hypothetical protein